MKIQILFLITLSLAFSNANYLHAEIIAMEDFEDASVSYVPSLMDDLSDIDARDYFGRIGPDTVRPPADVAFTNLQGAGYYGVQDSDSIANNSVDTVRLDWIGIDTSAHTNLNLAWHVAEDDADDDREDWDAPSRFTIQVQRDGGGYVDIFQVASENVGLPNSVTGGDRLNERPLVDTDFNGVGDGQEITSMFAQFNADLADANTIDIRAIFSGLDSSDEDFALDNVILSGDIAAVPEPNTTMVCFAVALAACLCRRKER